MKKIFLILCSFLLLSSTFTVSGLNIIQEEDLDIDKYIDAFDNENSTNQLKVAGPRTWPYFRMRVDEGSIIDRTMIFETLTVSVIARILFYSFPLMRPTIFVVSEDSKIDFTIEFKRDIPQGNSSKFRYLTQFGEYVNGSFTSNSTSIYNAKHTLKVEGFYGAILITKRCLALHPVITMSGRYDTATLVD